MDNPIYTYDDKKHVTAGQLKACGLTIPDPIPDRAFVPRDGVRFDIGRLVTDGELCGASFQIYMSQPFRWVDDELYKKDKSVKLVPKEHPDPRV